MTTFGKVLAILNVLAAAAFVWLAVVDYSIRQGLAFQIQQEDFLIRGLPVDETEKSPDGDALVELVGNRMLQQLGGIQVKTQKDAVIKHHDKLVREINEAAGPEKKTRLKEVVIPLAHSALDRATLRERIDKAKDDELDSFLGSDSLFDKAYTEASGTSLALDPRRTAIAHFLFCTSKTQQDYQYAMTVTGLDQYAREVERQGVVLRDMVPEIELAMAGDRGAFEAHHRTLIEEIVRLADHVRRLQGDLEKQNAQLAQYQGLITERTNDVNDLVARIAAKKKETASALAQQAGFEKALFEAQQTIAKTDEANQRLEREIKNRELGR